MVLTPPSGAWSTAVAILVGGCREGGKCDRLGPWLGKRTRQCGQQRHHARPSPPANDWLLRPLTRRASSSVPHVRDGLFSFPLGREEAMAAMASFGALALFLLFSLSCCSGSGRAGACFGRASVPWQVVLGKEGCGRGGGLASPGFVATGGIVPPQWVSCRGYRSTTHTTTTAGSQVAERNFPVCFWESPKVAPCSSNQLQLGR